MINVKLNHWLNLLLYGLIWLKAEGSIVGITYVQNATVKGAVCLDGSPPAYHLNRGSGTGINSWLVQLEGGGWCNNVTSCLARMNSGLGSSKQMAKEIAFSGILSNRPHYNPDFYNWNRIKIRYCDGSSFTGDVEAVNPETNLHFRGARVWIAVIEDLLNKGMRHAQNAILSGCSAGGLASILHCDGFRSLFPVSTNVKCLSDAGFFINTRDVSGAQHIGAYFGQVVKTHGSVKYLPRSCTSKMTPPWLCFFPQYITQQVQTPLFVINAAYDSWQVRNILVPRDADPHGYWENCEADINECLPSQLRILQGFRMKFLSAVYDIGNSASRGMFIDSCFAHCQTETQMNWFWPNSPSLNNTTIAKAVGEWFYDRSHFQNIDCPYPCNPTCLNRVYDTRTYPNI